MNKIKIAGLVAAAAMLLPMFASAATLSNPLFSNGQTSIDAVGGSTVSGTATLTVGSGEVVEFLRSQSDPSQPFVDTSVGGQLGYQEQVYTNIPFSVKVPPNTGTYYPTLQGAGIYGGGRSINGADNVVLGATNLGTVRVVASNPSDTTGGPAVGSADWIAALVASIKASLTPATPAPSNKCAEVNAKLVGTMDNTYNSANVKLQGYLLSEGMSIPALAAGASFGYKGQQTNAALAQFKASNQCI